MTYLELRTELSELFHDDSQGLGNPATTTGTKLIQFITKAEQRIGRDVRIIENYIQSTETPSSGVVTLPTRMAELVRVSRGSGASQVILTPVPASAQTNYGTGGNALAYSVSDAIYLYPSADTDVDLTYFEYPETLVGAADGATRPILTRYQNLYLYGAAADASLYLRDYDALARFEAWYSDAVAKANTAAREVYPARSVSVYAAGYAASPPRGL